MLVQRYCIVIIRQPGDKMTAVKKGQESSYLGLPYMSGSTTAKSEEKENGLMHTLLRWPKIIHCLREEPLDTEDVICSWKHGMKFTDRRHSRLNIMLVKC